MLGRGLGLGVFKVLKTRATGGGTPPPVIPITYRQPGGIYTYLRPDGSYYVRP